MGAKDSSGAREYERGLRDGERSKYDPPHKDPWKDYGPGSYSKDEVEDRKDYNQGYRHGRDS